MYQIFSCIRDDHNFAYVVAAVLVCTTGAACSLIVFQRGLLSATPVRQRIWAGLSGVVVGIGIWATHFIAMLGYRPGFAVNFDGAITLTSVVIAMTGFILVSQILIVGMSMRRRVVCALLVTLTVASMHYYGATALKSSALIEYSPVYVVASILVSLTFFGVTYCFGLSKAKRWPNFLALATTLIAVASLHFIGMTAMNVVPMKGMHDVSWAVDTATLSAWLVVGVVGIILLAALAAGFDTVVAGLKFRAQRRFSLLVNAASEAILVISRSGIVVEVNDAAEELLGQSRNSLMGQEVNKLLRHDVFAAHKDDKVATGEQYIRVDDEERPVDISVRDLEDDSTGLKAVTLYDLRERVRNEANIRKLAYSDQLTELPNRTAFQKALDGLWDGSQRVGDRFSVYLVDLDEFKEVNDQFGHEAGDEVLRETAIRLRSTFGAAALVARLGGDEFAVLLPEGEDEAKVVTLAEECVVCLARPIKYGDVTVRSGASVGVAIANSHQGMTDPSSLLKAADRALYSAKEAGRRTSRLYDTALHERTEQKRTLESDLVRAVRKNEFVLHYQSKVCSRTRTILGYEALIRWNRPGHGLVLPGEFIEVAEQSLIIQDIGRWCIYEACREAASWEGELSVSVNLSARQFMDPNLYATIRDALRKSGLPAHRLEMEITETALIQNTMVAARILGKLKKLGIQIALDDFGTGYSSMSFIQQFPFDRIKIDRSFVSTMETDHKAYAIIDAILRLGDSLSIPVVAEGVETEEQARRLIEARCGELQGFLISRPAPLAGSNFNVILPIAEAS